MKCVWGISRLLVILSELPSGEIVAFKNICTMPSKMKLRSWLAPLEVSVPWSKEQSWDPVFVQLNALFLPILLYSVHTYLYVASDRGTESIACRKAQAVDQGSFCTEYFTSCKKFALVASTTDLSAIFCGVMFKLSRLSEQVCLDPNREGAAELGLNSPFYMGMHIKCGWWPGKAPGTRLCHAWWIVSP